MKEHDDKKWKVLKSKYLFKKPWLTVRSDHVILPTGAHIPDYYIFEYPEWVNTIAITKEGLFVLVRQYRHGLQLTDYELCAGVCDKEDEDFLTAAKRELFEETGYGNGHWESFMTICANSSTMTNLTHCFLATDVELQSTQHLDETEDLSVHLLTKEEVYDLLVHDRMKQSLMAAPLWKYFAMQKK